MLCLITSCNWHPNIFLLSLAGCGTKGNGFSHLGRYSVFLGISRVCRRYVCVLVTQSCLTLRPYGPYPARILCPWNSPGKKTGVGSHSLLQGTFPVQGLNLGLIERTSLVAQMVKRLPTMRETQVQSLGQEDPLEKGMASHSSILTQKIPEEIWL